MAIYLVAGTLWILLSDRLLLAWVSDPVMQSRLALGKGWFFVAVTGVLLFGLLRRELELRRVEAEKLRLFIEHAPVALAMLDRELRYVTVSRRWCADYGLTAMDLRGRRHTDVFPDLPERWRELNRRVIAGETLRAEADPFVRADGTTLWLRWEARPWAEADGVIGGLVLFTEDITARRQTELALEVSRSRLKLALQSGHVGTWNWDLVTGAIECDEAMAGLVGRSSQDFARGGVEFFDACLHPDDRAAVQEARARAMREGGEFAATYRFVRGDGSLVWISDRARVERAPAGEPLRLSGASADVTGLKEMERALEESENRFREVVETIHEVFWISDVAKNRVLYVSPAYAEIWGRPCVVPFEAGRAWLDAVHPDDRERVRLAALTRQVAGTYDETYRIVRPDQTVRWIRDQAYPVRDAQGTVVRIVGTAEDVTERKRLEEQFLRAQRLEAIGTLASGVSHDLNNILAPMFMIAPLLRPKLTDPSDGELLTILERSAARGAGIVRQLLTFSRGIAGDRGPLQLRHLMKEMVAIMSETFPREIGIVEEVPADLPPVVGDATQIHQVLMNLCVNARDAMPKGGILTIGAREAELSVDDLRGQSGIGAGRFVVLTIRDSGHGIPAELRTRIFDPFFTTKAVSHGTGLGLPTVLGIAKSHGGFVTLESEVGSGSAFSVHLPVAAAEDPAGTIEPPVALPGGTGELVLGVDDEPAIRVSMRRVLERRGYRVLVAADGREALGVFLRERDALRVVVTDLMMPEMGGLALVQALRELKPELAILAVTGLEGVEQREALRGLGVTGLLPKPYSPMELCEALRRELERTKSAAV